MKHLPFMLNVHLLYAWFIFKFLEEAQSAYSIEKYISPALLKQGSSQLQMTFNLEPWELSFPPVSWRFLPDTGYKH